MQRKLIPAKHAKLLNCSFKYSPKNSAKVSVMKETQVLHVCSFKIVKIYVKTTKGNFLTHKFSILCFLYRKFCINPYVPQDFSNHCHLNSARDLSMFHAANSTF